MLFTEDAIFSIESDYHLKKAFLEKYNLEGDLQWQIPYPVLNNLTFKYNKWDENLYISGNFKDSILLGNNTIISKGEFDGVLLKMNKNGEIIWSKTVEGPNSAMIMDLDVKDSIIWIVGNFADKANIIDVPFSEDGNNLFLSQINTNGESIKILNYKSKKPYETSKWGQKITFEKDAVYVGFYFRGDEEIGNISLITEKENGLAIAKISEAGEVVWSRIYFSNDVYNRYYLVRLEADSGGDFYAYYNRDASRSPSNIFLLKKSGFDGVIEWSPQAQHHFVFRDFSALEGNIIVSGNEGFQPANYGPSEDPVGTGIIQFYNSFGKVKWEIKAKGTRLNRILPIGNTEALVFGRVFHDSVYFGKQLYLKESEMPESFIAQVCFKEKCPFVPVHTYSNL